MPFGRKRPGSRDTRAPGPIYLELRVRAIDVTPAELGLAATTVLPRVWGVLMEMGLGHGVATLVGFADGATSPYTSGGGGIIGGGEHAHIAALTRRFLEGVEASLHSFQPTVDFPLPQDRRTRFAVLTYEGKRATEADTEAMGEGRDPLSPLFHLAQDVITELPLIDEAAARR
jgi:hypothetical protein